MATGSDAEKKTREPLKKFRISGETVVDAALLELATVLAEIARGETIQEQTEAQDAEEATL